MILPLSCVIPSKEYAFHHADKVTPGKLGSEGLKRTPERLGN